MQIAHRDSRLTDAFLGHVLIWALWGALIFGVVGGVCATLSGLIGSELSRRSDLRVASANAQAEKAKADAASAELEANEAQERTARTELKNTELQEKLKFTQLAIAARAFTKAQEVAFYRELRGQKLTIAVCYPDDPEDILYAIDLMRVLTLAGQDVQDVAAKCGETIISGVAKGFVIYASRSKNGEDFGQDPLYRALVRADLFGGISTKMALTDLANMHVLIVPRRGAPPRAVLDAEPKWPVAPTLPPKR